MMNGSVVIRYRLSPENAAASSLISQELTIRELP
jgi:hypothetical protein